MCTDTHIRHWHSHCARWLVLQEMVLKCHESENVSVSWEKIKKDPEDDLKKTSVDKHDSFKC